MTKTTLIIEIKTERRSTGYYMGKATQIKHRGVLRDTETGDVVAETAWSTNKAIAKKWAADARVRLLAAGY